MALLHVAVLGLACAAAFSAGVAMVQDEGLALLQSGATLALRTYPGQPDVRPKSMQGAVDVVQFDIGDKPEAWRRAGFAVDEQGMCRFGNIRIHLVGGEGGNVVGLTVRGRKKGSVTIGGVNVTMVSTTKEPELKEAPPNLNPNRVQELMKILWVSPDFWQTSRQLEALWRPNEQDAGMDNWFGKNFERLEVIGAESGFVKPFTGRDQLCLFLVVPDMDALVTSVGEDNLEDINYYGDRLITHLNKEKLGMSVHLSFIVPGIEGKATNGLDGHGEGKKHEHMPTTGTAKMKQMLNDWMKDHR